IFTKDFGPREIQLDKWKISGVDINEMMKMKRRSTVALVEQQKPIDETDYLLLSGILEVPIDICSFALDASPNFLRKLRRSVCCLPHLEFDDAVLLKFLKIKRALEKKQEKEDDDEEKDDEEKDDEEDEKKEEKGDDEKKEEKEDDEVVDEVVELLLHEMLMDAKKSENPDVEALAKVTRRTAERMFWPLTLTEESFIDQHVLAFIEYVLLTDRSLLVSRSSGHIHLSDTEPSSSNGIDSCHRLKPDFLIMMPFKGSNVGLVAVEVKQPSAKSSQVLSDKSKLALECKRMVDDQVLKGSKDPRSFGVLVAGYDCLVFSCTLNETGVYLFVEEEAFSLVKTMNDLAILPDVVRVFCRLKRMMSQSMANLTKKKKVKGSSRVSLTPLIKPTVALPTGRCSVPSTQ
ncbi:hypothetical protein EDC96DRAFT_499302, partial [Choanephora cucurbitarum]